MLQWQGLEYRQDGFVLSQCLEDDVALGVVLSFFGRKYTLCLQHVHDGLVLGQQREFTGPEPIGPTVTNLRNRHHPMPNVQHGQRRGHMVSVSWCTVMLADRRMGQVYCPDELLAHWEVLFCCVNEDLDHGIYCDLAGNLSPLVTTQTIGHHQHSTTHTNVMMEQLWPQLVSLYPDHFAGQIGHHEVVLIVYTLQSSIGEPEDNHLMCCAVRVHTFCHQRADCLSRGMRFLPNASILWKRCAGSTAMAFWMMSCSSGSRFEFSSRGGGALPSRC